MRVWQAIALLQHQDPDLLVTIATDTGPMLHPTIVRHRRALDGDPGHLAFTVPFAGFDNPAPYPRTDPSTMWRAPEPTFTLEGRFRQPDLLLARLDPDVPLGAPT